MMERKIIIGLIADTDFLRKIYPVFSYEYLESNTARQISRWCLEYYAKYDTAPGKNIEQIFRQHEKQLQDDLREEIEEEILPDLSEEYVRDKGTDPYLFDQSLEYLQQQQLKQHTEQINILLDKGEIQKAKELQDGFTPITIQQGHTLQFNSPDLQDKMTEALNKSAQNIIWYPGALGDLWNDQMVRGAFVSFLAPEKRGKTYLMMELAFQALRQGRKVAFIQAGDMTERDFLRRMGVYFSRVNTKESSCKNRVIPVRDCLLNQLDKCDRRCRECDFGVFDGGITQQQIRQEYGKKEYLEALNENSDYAPCRNCVLYKTNGAIWFERVEDCEPLTAEQAIQATDKRLKKYGKNFRLSTYANMTLSVQGVDALLQDWKKLENWEPDVLIIDYADLLVPGVKMEYRHQQNHIWKELRRISQQTNALVITATQADANSYDRDTLTLKNFSEDKRKFAHVTAFWGMNQDKQGREKGLGILRFNELLSREGVIEPGKQVAILQCLDIGRPYLGSFYV